MVDVTEVVFIRRRKRNEIINRSGKKLSNVIGIQFHPIALKLCRNWERKILEENPLLLMPKMSYFVSMTHILKMVTHLLM